MRVRPQLLSDGRPLKSRLHAPLLLFSSLVLLAMVGCRLSNPVGPDHATQNAITHTADPTPIRRAPIDPPADGGADLAVPQNLQVSDVNWAWRVNWDATDGSAGYQLYQYRPQTESWEQLAETHATEFQVPKASAPRALCVCVRAVGASGQTSEFSPQVSVGDQGGGGGVHDYTFDDPQ